MIYIASVGSNTLVVYDNNLLHALQTYNLLSIQKLYSDNQDFIEFYSDWFSSKDLHSKDVVLQDKSENGLYKL